MTELLLDPDRTDVRIQTFAEGLFARLAHDLELVCRGLTGSARRDGSHATASLEARVGGIDVAGVRDRSGAVNPRALSASDRADCLEKMRKDVFHASADAVVRIEATLDGDTARIRLTPPSDRAVEVVVRPRIDEIEGGAARVSGAFELSLASIGSDVVKGPMGAFRVKDRVTVSFEAVFQPA